MLKIDCDEFVKDHAFEFATYTGHDVVTAKAYSEWYGREFVADPSIIEFSHRVTFPLWEATIGWI